MKFSLIYSSSASLLKFHMAPTGIKTFYPTHFMLHLSPCHIFVFTYAEPTLKCSINNLCPWNHKITTSLFIYIFLKITRNERKLMEPFSRTITDINCIDHICYSFLGWIKRYNYLYYILPCKIHLFFLINKIN